MKRIISLLLTVVLLVAPLGVSSYAESNYDDLVLFGSKLKDISGRRNNAAHGGSIITQEDTIEDKKNVYDNSRESKGMIFELLSILYN